MTSLWTEAINVNSSVITWIANSDSDVLTRYYSLQGREVENDGMLKVH